MIRFIPLNFYDDKLTNSYGSESRCLKEHGTAYGYEEEDFSLEVGKFENGVLVKCPEKEQAFKIRESKERRAAIDNKLRSEYQKIDPLLLEIMAKKIEGKNTEKEEAKYLKQRNKIYETKKELKGV